MTIYQIYYSPNNQVLFKGQYRLTYLTNISLFADSRSACTSYCTSHFKICAIFWRSGSTSYSDLEKKNYILYWKQLHSDITIDFTYKYSRHQNQMHKFLHWYHPCLNTLLCMKKCSFHTKIALKYYKHILWTYAV